ncbi:DNA replication ATP-dependent helicase/nuclease Dna2 [Nematocida sp. AWRm77]|nr:DNA replication ATP-dependent helicase/nuclease Dna2 [Nematocida sp. AWRm77]
MTIGWETPKYTPNPKKVKIDVEEPLAGSMFWDDIVPPSSPPLSEIGVDLEKKASSKTFCVSKITRTERSDKLEGENRESVEVFGHWRKALPRIGQTVTVVECLCCVQEDTLLQCVTDKKNYLVIHSERSLKTTCLIEALDCPRKALLVDKVSVYDGIVSMQQLFGLIVHEWFEYLAKNRNSSAGKAIEELKTIFQRQRINVYRAGVVPEELFRKILQQLGSLRTFIGTLEFDKCRESRTTYSSLFQIKGKPDLTIMKKTKTGEEETEIELKTGARLHASNQAQVILYGLLQKERNQHVSQLLYHLTTNTSKPVPLKHFELVCILTARNELAQNRKLPPRKEISHCQVCHTKDTCMQIAEIEEADTLQNKVVSNGSEQKENQSGLPSAQVLGKGEAARLLRSLEFGSRALLWHLWNAVEEEEKQATETLFPVYIHTWTEHYLKIHHDAEFARTLRAGEYVVVYTHAKATIAKGVISVIADEYAEIRMFEDLIYSSHTEGYISKDPCTKVFAEMRTSLLLLANSPRVQRVWKTAPVLASADTGVPAEFQKEVSLLNLDQKHALLRALNSSPYTLIHGMPGSGKTRLISLLVRILVAKGKSVLICCYTRLSLYNIEKSLMPYSYIHMYQTGKPEIPLQKDSKQTVAQYLRSRNVVLSTTRGLFSDVIFEKNRIFDMYIADEATQQNFLASVVPTMISRSFVLVGDHLQLCPLANTEELKLSLFELLRPNTEIAALTRQYRMGESIMDIANQMFYNGQMKCCTQVQGSISFFNVASDKSRDIISSVPSTVQILCYYNDQVQALKQIGKRAETIDRFQGSEANNILLLIDTLTATPTTSEVLISPQRLNVALTRAKQTLVILGNASLLKEIPLFSKLLDLLPPEEIDPVDGLDKLWNSA